jgi:ABC-type nitrate/sulfonate/bicarbonate transport system substrate-binding protein
MSRAICLDALARRTCAALALLIGMLAQSVWGADNKIRIAFPSGMNGMIPVVMERAGIAKKHGLEASFSFFQNGPPMLEALASGNVDTVITSLQPATSYLSRAPGKAIIVANLGYASHSLMVPKNSPVKDVKDLANRRVAVSFGTSPFLDLRRLLKSIGLDEKTGLSLVNSGPNEMQSAFEQGLADAIVNMQPQVLRLQEQTGARVIYSWPSYSVSIMSTEYLANNPQVKEAYQQALQDSIEFIARNTEQASTWFGEHLRLDPRIVKQVAAEDSNYRKIKNGETFTVKITPEFRKVMEDWFQTSYEMGMIKVKVDTSKPYF